MSSPPIASTLAQAFDAFRRSIEMRRDLIQAITAQQTPLRERLQKRWPGAKVFYSGSYGRSTKIEPITDVDLFVVRPEQYREIGKIPISRDQFLDETLTALREVFPTQNIRRQTRSLGILFPEFRIDLVPAFSRSGGGYFIPDRGQGTPDWLFTHPEKQAAFTASLDRDTGQMATPLVKMMKVWNRNRVVGLKSYHMEVMVLRALDGKPPGYASGMKTLFERLEHSIKRSCGDPGESGGKLDTYLDGMSRERASQEARRAAGKMAEAVGLVTLKREAEAIRIVADLMGTPFPKG